MLVTEQNPETVYRAQPPSQVFSLARDYSSPVSFTMTHAPFCKKAQANGKVKNVCFPRYVTAGQSQCLLQTSLESLPGNAKLQLRKEENNCSPWLSFHTEATWTARDYYAPMCPNLPKAGQCLKVFLNTK